MREIKFRAWDDKDKVMYINVIPIPEYTNASYQFNGYLLIEELPGYHFMQYTGLKDKNGVEIYVGDICNTHLDSDFPYQREIVQLSDSPVIEFKPATGTMLVEGNMKDTEVIGNIYENPELLKGDK